MRIKQGALSGITFTILAALFATSCGGANPAFVAQGQHAQPAQDYRLAPNIQIPDSSILRAGQAHTNHVILSGASTQVLAPSFVGYAPVQIRAAYGLPSTGGSGTIVIVDAYDDYSALADFNTFSTQYGLPKETSTNVTASTNQHLQVVYAAGTKPQFNSGWSQEEDLDIEWAHAMAPNAKIVLIEAITSSATNLYAADDLAAKMVNAHQCSNSWSFGESMSEAGSDGHFDHAGIVYFASSGDSGGQREYPATSPNVVSVGGTTLLLDSTNHRSSETAWSGTGCGISPFELRPSYQNAITAIVGTHRGTADIAAVADPNTGVRVVWNGSWKIFGGTSVSCPIVAGITNLSGTNRAGGVSENTFIYSRLGTSSFYDVTKGTAGILKAATGWDCPTGCGTPKGLTGF